MLENRDYTIIIDNSATMAKPNETGNTSRWLALQESILALARKCEEFDPDGITVYLFSHRFERFDHVTSAKVAQIFAQEISANSTNLLSVLQDAINNYFARKAGSENKQNGEIILVVSDGTKYNHQGIVDMIIDATHKMDSPTELGISFIQVGSDSQTTKFFQSLDNKLQSIGAKFDICDTIKLEELNEISLTEVLLNAVND
jgi:hypothetical protein